MKIFQSELIAGVWTQELPDKGSAQWVLAFGNRSALKSPQIRQELHKAFPSAAITGCTTSGEIQGISLYDGSLCITAVDFAKTQIHCASANIAAFASSRALAHELVRQTPIEGLRHLLVLADGQLINGSELVAGLSESLPTGVQITGGLAGDGTRFQETEVWHNDTVAAGLVVMIGFYGVAFVVGHGQMGGWKAFGPERYITRAKANVLYEIDHRPALQLYKEYLGDHAAKLPASALLFPIAIMQVGDQEPIVRTILSIDEAQQTMLFAGDMPEGARCQLMLANYENLVDGASGAAHQALTRCAEIKPQLAILISCVGRRLVLDQRTEEELEVVADAYPDCPLTGFYSYGEISPLLELGKCGLHNQTMTITLLSEQ